MIDNSETIRALLAELAATRLSPRLQLAGQIMAGLLAAEHPETGTFADDDTCTRHQHAAAEALLMADALLAEDAKASAPAQPDRIPTFY